MMKKLLLLGSLILILNGCSILSELTAFTKCEFRLLSVQDPTLCSVNVSQKRTWSDFSFMEGQSIALQLLQKKLPFDITVNVEAKNPGTTTAAVNSIEWIAFIDDLQVAQGVVSQPVEVPPSGGVGLIPVQVHVDLMNYLEGDNPSSMLNFALNMVGAGDQTSKVTMKIKPSVLAGSQNIQYPGYFNITHEFSSGN
jgi:LEA14-like dessication related protein